VLRPFQGKNPEPSDSTLALQVLEQEVTSAIAQDRMTMWSQELRDIRELSHYSSSKAQFHFFRRPNTDTGFNSLMSTEALIYINVQDLKIHLLPYVLLSEKKWLTNTFIIALSMPWLMNLIQLSFMEHDGKTQ